MGSMRATIPIPPDSDEELSKCLKPCPFCGGKAEIVRPYYGATGAYIFCTDCRLSTNRGFCRDNEALEELTVLWNRRVRG